MQKQNLTRRHALSLLLLSLLSFSFLHATPLAAAEPPQKITTVRLPLIPGMTRAELKHDTLPPQCAGILLLCPGFNQDGEYLIREQGWRDLAKKHQLLLVALSFASKEGDLSSSVQRGYYYVEKGSGKVLLDGLKKIAGKELPISMFGFSGGAHFTHRFVYKNPTKVKVWCAYSFGWFAEAPKAVSAKPPGIFVCGLKDERLASTRNAFLSARRAQWRAAWLGVPNSGHSVVPGAATQVRQFFEDVLSMKSTDSGHWVDIPKTNGFEKLSVKSWAPGK
jgi:hypothetical protein